MKTDYTLDAMHPADWAQVQAIYLEGIDTGNATFETEARPGRRGMQHTSRLAGWLYAGAMPSSGGPR
jgi:hypothetical protein